MLPYKIDIPNSTNAAVLHKPFDIRIEKQKLKYLNKNNVLIKTMAVGICGSDVHYYESGAIGAKKLNNPIILGHECSGIVLDVGENVKNVEVGDRVAVEPGDFCGVCDFCKKGKYNLCNNISFLSSTPKNVAFAKYIILPSILLYEIPDNFSLHVYNIVNSL